MVNALLCNPLFSVCAGTVLGFLSGLGTGGGSLLILWLTVVLKMAPEEARRINLMFFLPSALIACLFRWKQGKLDFRALLPAVAAGCVAAFFTSRIEFEMALLQKLFGGLLILTGLRELFYRPRKAR